MIDFLNGQIAELNPAVAIVECGGVGYEVNITLMDYPQLKPDEKRKFYIHESIREDAHILYGFLDKRSRELFQQLIGVSGVGPSTGRMIMSALNAEQLATSISTGDVAPLKAVKGVGAKTAQRIIVDLKDKIKVDTEALSYQLPGVVSEAFDDSLAALTMLGFNSVQSQKALKKLFSENPALTTEQAIKQALTML